MVFDELGRFQRMEDPEERKPEELKRKKGKVKAPKAGQTLGTVSLKTVRRSSTLLIFLLWGTFALGIVLVAYRILGAYAS